jgi:4-amino-4-deoxy-L-arabinose transferase-like glycosyltransferase
MVAAVAMFGRQHFGRRTAILAAAFLCSVEVFVITATWPYADVPTGMFGLLAILALANWQLGQANGQLGQANRQIGQRSGRPWLIASVIFAVFAAHSKLNGLFVYVAVALGIGLGLWWQRRELRKRLLDVALAVVTGLLLASIWTVVENSLSPGSGNAVSQITDAAASFAPIGNDSVATDLLARVVRYFVVIWEMTVIGQQGGLDYDGTISPFFLIVVPLLLILPKKPRVVWALLAAGLVEFGAWLLVPGSYYQNRHLIIAYPIFSLLAAYFISRLPELDHPRFSISGFVRILIVLVFGFQLLFFLGWYQSLDPSAYLLGLQSREGYLSAHLNGGSSPGYFAMMQTMNEQLPEDSIVGVAWPEPRVYYCQNECIRYVFRRTGSAARMSEIARSEGITHLLVSEAGLDYWLEFSEENHSSYQANLAYANALDEFVEEFGVLEHDQDESFYLYRLEMAEE